MTIDLICGDITEQNVDAIVNAANKSLLGGGGVDGAIHKKAGPQLLDECKQFGGCNTGEAVITNAYNLPSNYVIHTPGPVWKGGNQEEQKLLEACYRNSLQRAYEKSLISVAFPAISTGVYGYPLKEAAKVAYSTVKNWEKQYPHKIIFVTFNQEDFKVYKEVINNDL